MNKKCDYFVKNGVVETVKLAWLWTLMFGSLYFLIKENWIHTVLSAILAILIFGMSWLVYPFLSKKIMIKHYLKNDWECKDETIK